MLIILFLFCFIGQEVKDQRSGCQLRQLLVSIQLSVNCIQKEQGLHLVSYIVLCYAFTKLWTSRSPFSTSDFFILNFYSCVFNFTDPVYQRLPESSDQIMPKEDTSKDSLALWRQQFVDVLKVP